MCPIRQNEAEISEKPTPPIISDGQLVDLALQVGERIWHDDTRLVENEFLNGDNASYYFDYARGVFFIFTAKIPGRTFYPFHNEKFDFDENILWKSVATLHQFILNLDNLQ